MDLSYPRVSEDNVRALPLGKVWRSQTALGIPHPAGSLRFLETPYKGSEGKISFMAIGKIWGEIKGFLRISGCVLFSTITVSAS